jgi:hypothetical protein
VLSHLLDQRHELLEVVQRFPHAGCVLEQQPLRAELGERHAIVHRDDDLGRQPPDPPGDVVGSRRPTWGGRRFGGVFRLNHDIERVVLGELPVEFQPVAEEPHLVRKERILIAGNPKPRLGQDDAPHQRKTRENQRQLGTGDDAHGKPEETVVEETHEEEMLKSEC